MTGDLKKKQTGVVYFPEFLKCATCTLGSNHKHVTEQKCMYLNTWSYDDTMFLKYILGSMHLCLGINIGKANEIFKTTKMIIFKIRKIKRKVKFWFETRILYKTIMNFKKAAISD